MTQEPTQRHPRHRAYEKARRWSATGLHTPSSAPYGAANSLEQERK